VLTRRARRTQANPTPNDQTDLRELQRVLFVFLHSIASCELSGVLLSDQNRPHLFELLGMIADGLAAVPDAGAQRLCAITFQLLVRDWFPAPPEADPELHGLLRRFVFERITPASFRATSLPSFDSQDAGCATLLVAVCALHRTLFERLGTDWLDYLLVAFFPSLNCPAATAQEYCKAVAQTKSPKELRAHYRRLFIAPAASAGGALGPAARLDSF
jgi:hypothetical protein